MHVVTGASGRFGRLAVERLRERVDASSIVAVTRTPERIADLGVVVRQADFTDPGSLTAAFDGADRVLVSATGARSLGRRAELHRNAFDAAVKAGAGHVLYQSMVRAGEPGHPLSLMPEHGATERVLAESGVPFTVVRLNVEPDVLLMTLPLAEAVATGTLATANGSGHVGYVTWEDSAEVGAALLAEGGHEGQYVDVSGPAALDHGDVADALAEATGRPVRYEPGESQDDWDTYLARLPEALTSSVPEQALRAGFEFWTCAEAGWFDVVTHTVPRLTGRPATSLAGFLTAHRDQLLGRTEF
ncbi:NAD(P)H-binding protein [Lentzea sp.]|uniref:NAD(P)H-binding protein n=1 Tax=Lentzea sp. TaxID=56099 RepID=UPI002C2283D7|nr:NAD(P)H-binding protein [Lentzea sp.]HUQ54777.1 NAD(P)H-binding protein [Lentzea sp.]